MKLIPSTPSSALSRVSDFDEWFRSPFAGLPSLSRFFDWGDGFGNGYEGSLATDIHEDNDNYYARFELPGVKKNEVHVELSDRMLSVTAQSHRKSGDEESSFTLSRSIAVPEGVKSDDIIAKLEDGILTVTLPKSEERKPKTIELS